MPNPAATARAWTDSWLGYFTLTDYLFSVDPIDFTNLPDDVVQQILVRALAAPDLWTETKPAGYKPAWEWARIIVRLLAVLIRPANHTICKTAASTVARFMVTAAGAPSDINDINWSHSIPIFPDPRDLERLLWLLDDDVLLQPDILTIFVKSHTGAIQDRLSVVEPYRWTPAAVTQFMNFGAIKSIPIVAWAGWFAEGRVHFAVQSAAVGMMCGPVRMWASLLRIHARIPTGCAPPRRANPLARLLSNNAGAADVRQMLADWVVHPTAVTHAEVNRWALAVHGQGMMRESPVIFVLTELRRYCSEFVVPLLFDVDTMEKKGLVVWEHLMTMASTGGSTRVALLVLFFVVYYAPECVLIATASHWVRTLRSGLEAVDSMPFDDNDHQIELNTLLRLERRCAMICPRSGAVNVLSLGLHMTTVGNYPSEIMQTTGDEANMRQLVALLGGGREAVRFLFRHTTKCQRWRAWAVLVTIETAAWKQFVQEAPYGRVAVKNIFRQFHVMPTDNPEKHAWCATYSVAPHALHMRA